MHRNGRDQDPDVPHLTEARAPLPRGSTPPFQTPTASGLDAEIGSEMIPHLLQLCAENGISTDVPLGEALEELAERIAARGGDAGPSRQHLVDDAEPLDGEMIEKIMSHLDGRLSPAALEQLKEMLEGGPDEYDYMPPGLRDKATRDQFERSIEHLDPASACDAAEAINAIEQMRKTAGSAGDRRGALDQPPPFPGRPTPGGHP